MSRVSVVACDLSVLGRRPFKKASFQANKGEENEMQVSSEDSVNSLQQVERVRGIQSGELFVRLNGAELCAPNGTLHGARPFLQKLLHLHEDDSSAVRRLVQPSESKLTFSSKLRRQTRQRRHAAERHWNAVRDAVKAYGPWCVDPIANHSSSSTLATALDRYLQQFQRLEQVYRQHVASDILLLYALLEAESKYITAWTKREEGKCRDQRALTKLLYQLNSFALQLESETSGQVRMWRLPSTDAQRIRCVKAATENIKKSFFASSTDSLEVLEVYKIENRVLLNSFQTFASSLAQTTVDVKIKGLFCSIPSECVEHCVVYGMHDTVSDGTDEPVQPRLLDPAEVKIFNRPTLLQGHDDAPGTHMHFRARTKVKNSTSLRFPRRFSRYSTLEEMRVSMANANPALKDQPPPVQYLGLCRVALGKTVRVKDNTNSTFPDDASVGALHFTDEEEYLVRYPDAVVPEFLVQFRVVTPLAPLPVDFSEDSIIPVSLTSPAPSCTSTTFQDFIYSSAFDSSASTISAFPLSLPSTEKQPSFFSNNGVTSLVSSASQLQEEDITPNMIKEQRQVPAEIVLANCARQKAQLHEDLQRLERLFWTRAREIWEEEGIRGGVKLKNNNQPQSSRGEVGTTTEKLRGEMAVVKQLEEDLTRVTCAPQSKMRPHLAKHSARNSHKRR